MRKVKIIATFGPSTDKRSITRAALSAGVNVVRLNFSHGKQNEHKQRAKTVHEIASELGIPIAILIDLQGPKFRTGEVEGGSVLLKKGQRFIITIEDIIGDGKRVSTNFKELPAECKPGDHILIDDGKIRLEVVKGKGDEVITEVLAGGWLSDHKALNLPHTKIKTPTLTRKDLDDLNFAVKSIHPDYVALSFVRSAGDIKLLKGILKEKNCRAGIIAKIEKPEAVENIDEILSALDLGDGIMVARGDLGVECDIQAIPAIQKQLVIKANNYGLISIIATQMLESMMTQPMPSRAEASDIFNAVLDGTDAVMLSGETAVGKNPVESVKMMESLIEEAERYAENSKTARTEPVFCDYTFALATGKAACTAAESSGAKALAALSRSGRTALLMSKLSLPSHIPFYALTNEPDTLHKMSLYYGVIPILLSQDFDPRAGMWDIVDEALIAAGTLKKNDTIVIASGFKIGPGHTNVCKIVKLGIREYY